MTRLLKRGCKEMLMQSDGHGQQCISFVTLRITRYAGNSRLIMLPALHVQCQNSLQECHAP